MHALDKQYQFVNSFLKLYYETLWYRIYAVIKTMDSRYLLLLITLWNDILNKPIHTHNSVLSAVSMCNHQWHMYMAYPLYINTIIKSLSTYEFLLVWWGAFIFEFFYFRCMALDDAPGAPPPAPMEITTTEVSCDVCDTVEPHKRWQSLVIPLEIGHWSFSSGWYYTEKLWNVVSMCMWGACWH